MTEAAGQFVAPSGEQFDSAPAGGHLAIVTEVGATLRTYTVDGADVVDGFAIDERSSSGRGQVLAPWPNRLGDGRYEFDGQPCPSPSTSRSGANAIHGLVRWLPCTPLARRVMPWPWRASPSAAAYAWRLSLRIEYRLGGDGLTVVSEATNLSEVVAPSASASTPTSLLGRRQSTPRRW